MKGKIVMYGIEIPIEVPNKPEKKKRKRAKALSAPRKHRMVESPPVMKGEPRSTE